MLYKMDELYLSRPNKKQLPLCSSNILQPTDHIRQIVEVAYISLLS